MCRGLALLCLLGLGCSGVVTRHGGRRAPKADQHDAPGFIVLNGERTSVRWSDGDSFTFTSGRYGGQGTRMVGYNTLEAYGPVHRWGGWSREELFDVAKQGAGVAASREWECTTTGDEDTYHRVLVDCPTLAREMALRGVGMAYAVNGVPPVLVLDAMHQAQRARRGMWAKGVPRGVVTSLHSMSENDGRYQKSSNRVVDTRTGEAPLVKHTDAYQTCQEVCLSAEGSCMVYVPFEQRYQDQPPCLVGE